MKMKNSYFILLFLFLPLMGCDELKYKGKMDVFKDITFGHKKKEFVLSPGEYDIKLGVFKDRKDKENKYLKISLLDYESQGKKIDLDPIDLKLNESSINIHGKSYTIKYNNKSEKSEPVKSRVTVSCDYKAFLYRCDKESGFTSSGCQSERSVLKDETQLCESKTFRKNCESVFETVKGEQSAIRTTVTTHFYLDLDFISPSSNEVVAHIEAYSSSYEEFIERTGECN